MSFTLLPADGSRRVTITNLSLRLAQLLLAIIALIVYVKQGTTAIWTIFEELDKKFALVYTAAALSIATALAFIVTPKYIGYRLVCMACVWDFIVMCLWAAAFAYFKGIFAPSGVPKTERSKELLGILNQWCNNQNYRCLKQDDFNMMYDGVWLEIVNMLLWLSSTVLGASVLVMSRLRGTKTQS